VEGWEGWPVAVAVGGGSAEEGGWLDIFLFLVGDFFGREREDEGGGGESGG
jgi:hypothetical protein